VIENPTTTLRLLPRGDYAGLLKLA
jgi:hypothetical protein